MLQKVQNMTNTISQLIYTMDDHGKVMAGIAREICPILNSGFMLVDETGKIMLSEPCNYPVSLTSRQNPHHITPALNDAIREIFEPKIYDSLLSLDTDGLDEIQFKDYSAMVIPISSSFKRIGAALFFKEGSPFSQDDVAAAQVCILIIGLILGSRRDAQRHEDHRRISMARGSIDTLSYSEREAMINVFRELDGTEGLLVASKIADREGLTRSVIVNGLRKLESAGVIESRSLGMKGTYIKVLNTRLFDELAKLEG